MLPKLKLVCASCYKTRGFKKVVLLQLKNISVRKRKHNFLAAVSQPVVFLLARFIIGEISGYLILPFSLRMFSVFMTTEGVLKI